MARRPQSKSSPGSAQLEAWLRWSELSGFDATSVQQMQSGDSSKISIIAEVPSLTCVLTHRPWNWMVAWRPGAETPGYMTPRLLRAAWSTELDPDVYADLDLPLNIYTFGQLQASLFGLMLIDGLDESDDAETSRIVMTALEQRLIAGSRTILAARPESALLRGYARRLDHWGPRVRYHAEE